MVKKKMGFRCKGAFVAKGSRVARSREFRFVAWSPGS
jgi:hypothetical protein